MPGHPHMPPKKIHPLVKVWNRAWHGHENPSPEQLRHGGILAAFLRLFGIGKSPKKLEQERAVKERQQQEQEAAAQQQG